jgi:hypothetical protein
MTELFIGKPFVSHDGGPADDPNGFRAEVMVQKGIANIVSIEKRQSKDHGGTAKVTVHGENLNPKYNGGNIGGWLNTDTEAFKIVEEQYKKGEPIELRFEQQRLAKDADTDEVISRETPMAELLQDPTSHKNTSDQARRHVKKLLVGVAVPGGQMAFSQDQTSPAEDPSGPGSVASARDRQPSAPAAMPSQPRYAPETAESQPWKAYNPDGSLNPGSYGVHASLEFYFVISDQPCETNDKQKTFLVNKLLNICDNLQLSWYEDKMDHADRNLASYLRARDIVKHVVEHDYPLSADALNTNGIKEWIASVADKSAEIYQWAYEDYRRSL